MQVHPFGPLPPVSTLTLGGGGLGMLWGPTTFDECVATVHAAIDGGINLLDLAPRYGDGKAEEVVGAAFGGRLPDGVRVTGKVHRDRLVEILFGQVVDAAHDANARVVDQNVDRPQPRRHTLDHRGNRFSPGDIGAHRERLTPVAADRGGDGLGFFGTFP